MASSQAACVNLFLPILKDPKIAIKVLSSVKTDIKEIAVDQLDMGYRIEFWDEPDNVLNDHTYVSGTYADIAIAYYDHQDDLNLWLIELSYQNQSLLLVPVQKARGEQTHMHVRLPMPF